MLSSLKVIKVHSLFSSVMIGFMANNLLPARAGEFVRAYVVGRRENISKSASFATIVVERIFDGFTLLFFLIIMLAFFPFPTWVKNMAYMALGIYSFALVVVFLLKIQTRKTLNFLTSLLKPFPKKIANKVIELSSSFTSGLEILKQGKNILFVAFFSIVMWTIFAFAIYFGFLAFDFSLLFHASFVILVIVTLGILIPSSPGFVGTFQLFCISGLALFGIAKDHALSFSIAFHATQFVPTVFIGLICLWIENISLKEIKATR